MTHDEKVAHFEQLLRDRGFWLSNAIPPATRMLWWLGFETPPPYFLSFVTGALASGIAYGVLLGAMMSIFALLAGGHATTALFVSVVIAAVLFGLLMALFWRFQAHRLSLPAWQDFPHPHSINPIDNPPQPRSGDVI